MRFAQTLEADKRYHSYVKMQPVGPKTVAGDVYIFDDEEKIVGVVGGLKFHCIPRKLFNTFLPPADTSVNKAVARQTPAAQVTKQPPKVVKQVEQTKVTVKKVKKVESFSSGLTVKALNIIATEIGVEPSELADAIQFSDLGVDSLMSLTISGRFREELDLEVHSTLFTDFPTIGDVKTFLSQHETGAISEVSTDDSDGELTDGTEMTTPDPELDSRGTLPTTYSSTEKGRSLK
jgi:iron transport multicopper oxidase